MNHDFLNPNPFFLRYFSHLKKRLSLHLYLEISVFLSSKLQLNDYKLFFRLTHSVDKVIAARAAFV